MYEIQVCVEPLNSPRSYEPIKNSIHATPQDVIKEFNNLSAMYRCGKDFRVIGPDKFIYDIEEFMVLHV
jgi:hypothetical protein